MSYEKHNFQSGQKLKASQLNEMDEQIYELDTYINGGEELLNDNCIFADTEHNNISFNWIGYNRCHITGTNVTLGYCFILSPITYIPKWLKRGFQYSVKVNSDNTNICLQFFTFKNGVETGHRFYEDGFLLIPSDSDGISIRILVDNQSNANVDAIIEFFMFPNFKSGVSGEVEELKKTIVGEGSELLSEHCTFEDLTRNGVNFHWISPCICKITGRASSASQSLNMYASTTSIPDWLEKGKRYTVKVNNTQKGIALLHIFIYKNGVDTGYRFYEDGEFTIPVDADGILFRIRTYYGNYPVDIDDTITFGFYEPATGFEQRINSLEEKDLVREQEINYITEKINMSDTNVIGVTNDECINSQINDGHQITVITYNVANYNNDTSVFISDEKINNLKKFLSMAKADIICVQENRDCVDRENTKKAHNYIYKPVYPIRYGGHNSIFTKRSIQNQNTIMFTGYSDRDFSYGIMEIDLKKLLIISTHLPSGNDASGIESRRKTYSELMEWIHGEKDLSGIHRPDWDYCVICGDFNSATIQDRINIKELSDIRGFSMANGGWLGWIQTNTWDTSIDNIVCSQNIIINSIDVYESWKGLLYSDHYPMVCNLTLCE